MRRCDGRTKSGSLCRNQAVPKSDFCHMHRNPLAEAATSVVTTAAQQGAVKAGNWLRGKAVVVQAKRALRK